MDLDGCLRRVERSVCSGAVSRSLELVVFNCSHYAEYPNSRHLPFLCICKAPHRIPEPCHCFQHCHWHGRVFWCRGAGGRERGGRSADTAGGAGEGVSAGAAAGPPGLAVSGIGGGAALCPGPRSAGGARPLWLLA